MGKKLIISERQQMVLKESVHHSMVEKVVADLNTNYKRAIETYRVGGEYQQRKVFEVAVDGDVIAPKGLLKYLKEKYKVGEGFLKQVMNDWCDDKIKDGMLSKNIGLME